MNRSHYHFILGAVFLFLSKFKNLLYGYATPKHFDLRQVDRAIEYDIGVVNNWLAHLARYTNNNDLIQNKHILELGPGSDLGAGLYLISLGCDQYSACDVNNLAALVPDIFYDRLIARLAADGKKDAEALKKVINDNKKNRSARLKYHVNKDFNIVDCVGINTIDLVFSQAAFEHFDDVEKTIQQLSAVCKQGAIAVISVDLMTHSRWIRQKDPNNIYRFPDWFYRLFWYPGMPNRVRPWQYKAYFEQNGWSGLVIVPEVMVSGRQSSYEGVDSRFVDQKNEMELLSVVLCAIKT